MRLRRVATKVHMGPYRNEMCDHWVELTEDCGYCVRGKIRSDANRGLAIAYLAVIDVLLAVGFVGMTHIL